MTETTEDRKKRLFYQSHHRGQVENDLLLGRFARQHLSGLHDDRLDAYERLLDEADVDIWAWVTGMQALPARHDNDVFALLRAEAAGSATDRMA